MVIQNMMNAKQSEKVFDVPEVVQDGSIDALKLPLLHGKGLTYLKESRFKTHE